MRFLTVSAQHEVMEGATFRLEANEGKYSVIKPIHYDDYRSIAVSNALLFSADAILLPSKERVILRRATLVETMQTKFLLVPDITDPPAADSRNVLLNFPSNEHKVLSWCGHPVSSSPGSLLSGLIRLSSGQEAIVDTFKRVNRGTWGRIDMVDELDGKPFTVSFNGKDVLIDDKAQAQTIVCA